jgi:Uma2 family endonuclease
MALPLARPAVILDDETHIPADVHTLAAFRGWSREPSFPERGRIDFLAGDVAVDMSPEDLYTHGALKTVLAIELGSLVVKAGLGNVFIDRARVVSLTADLSVEPDLVVVLWPTLESGRVREIPSARGEGRYVEMEGAPDLVVEVVSDGSARKDRRRLPPLYARAGVPELWLVDARGPEVRFEIFRLGPEGYLLQAADADGWAASPVLGRAFRLTRRAARLARWAYELEHRPA